VGTAAKLGLVAGAVAEGVRGRSDGSLAAAERYCQRMARREAGNFYWGFIALPRTQRISIYALYDFARQIDDATDGPGTTNTGVRLDLSSGGHEPEPTSVDGAARAHLELQRQRLRRALAGEPTRDPVMRVLAGPSSATTSPRRSWRVGERGRDGSPPESLRHLGGSARLLPAGCRGGRPDVRAHLRLRWRRRPRARRFPGRGSPAHQHPPGRPGGRLAGAPLPAQDELARFGVSETSVLAGRPDGAWTSLVEFEAARARRLYASGIQVCEHIPGSARACVRTMAGIYSGILDRIEAEPELPLRQRVRLSSREKAGVMLRSWMSSTAAGPR